MRLQIAASPEKSRLAPPQLPNSDSAQVRHADTQRALLNILEDFGAEKAQMESAQRAVLNILDDFSHEKAGLQDVQRAVLNILDDFAYEKLHSESAQRAVINILDDFADEKSILQSAQRAAINILEDFASEKIQFEAAQRAVLNILEDFTDEKARLTAAERAMLNILEDFDAEKNKVENVNRQLGKEVDERRLAEQQLAVRATELNRSNADLEQFAYVASHDLQEPLRMVASYTQLLSRRYKGQLDADADEFIGFAVDGVKRMQSLIQDLLAYSRVGTSKNAIRDTASQAALDRALANLQGAIQDSGARVTHDPLPEVFADAVQVVQVFQNLIGNGIKYRRPVAPEIHVSAVSHEQEWVFSVRDNGIGISPQYFDRIFVLFQRLHQRDEYPGTGIGLTITKKIIERHGGRIWVESEPGQGSCFYFTLPKRRTG